jgi:hypothetical protein
MVHEAEIWTLRTAKQPVPGLIGTSEPDVVGPRPEGESDAEGGHPGFSGGKGGFKGAIPSKARGQPILSIADVQWVSDPGPCTIDSGRGTEVRQGLGRAAEGWRRKDDFTWPQVWGMRFACSAPSRWDPFGRRPPEPGSRRVGSRCASKDSAQFREGQECRRAQSSEDDVIIEVDGRRTWARAAAGPSDPRSRAKRRVHRPSRGSRRS